MMTDIVMVYQESVCPLCGTYLIQLLEAYVSPCGSRYQWGKIVGVLDKEIKCGWYRIINIATASK